jgi:hypothetical protein
MSDLPTLYRKHPMPPEPWQDEDNLDWILVQEIVQEPVGFSMLVPVEIDYEAAEAEYVKWSVVDDEQDIKECRRQARLVVDAALGVTDDE